MLREEIIREWAILKEKFARTKNHYQDALDQILLSLISQGNIIIPNHEVTLAEVIQEAERKKRQISENQNFKSSVAQELFLSDNASEEQIIATLKCWKGEGNYQNATIEEVDD